MSPLFGEPVVPRWSVRGVVALGLTTGLVSGLASAWLLGKLPVWPALASRWWFAGAVTLVLLAAGPIGYLVLVARATRRRWAPSVFAPVHAAGYVAAMVWGQSMRTPGWDWAAGESPWVQGLNVVVLIVVASVGCWLLVVLLGCALRVVVLPLEQTLGETLCRRCGYELKDVAGVCPECGADRAMTRYRGRRWLWTERALRRGGRAALVVTSASIAVWVGVRFVTDYLPGRAFRLRFDQGQNDCAAYIEDRPGGFMGTYWFDSAMGRTLGVNVPDAGGGPDGAIILAYRPRAREGSPVMQLQVVAVVSFPAPLQARPYTQMGGPLIVADFNASQAEDVIAHGVPRGLVDELANTAKRYGWSRTGAKSAGAPAEVRVDPQPYLRVDRRDR